MARSPGEAAYAKWVERVSLNDPRTPRLPTLDLMPWTKLTVHARATWEAVAKAAIEAEGRS